MDQLKAYVKIIYILGDMTFPQTALIEADDWSHTLCLELTPRNVPHICLVVCSIKYPPVLLTDKYASSFHGTRYNVHSYSVDNILYLHDQECI